MSNGSERIPEHSPRMPGHWPMNEPPQRIGDYLNRCTACERRWTSDNPAARCDACSSTEIQGARTDLAEWVGPDIFASMAAQMPLIEEARRLRYEGTT